MGKIWETDAPVLIIDIWKTDGFPGKVFINCGLSWISISFRIYMTIHIIPYLYMTIPGIFHIIPWHSIVDGHSFHGFSISMFDWLLEGKPSVPQLLPQPSPPPRQALPRCHAHQWAPAPVERQGDWTWTWKWLKGAPILAISIEKLMIDLSGLRGALVSDNPPIYFNGKFIGQIIQCLDKAMEKKGLRRTWWCLFRRTLTSKWLRMRELQLKLSRFCTPDLNDT